MELILNSADVTEALHVKTKKWGELLLRWKEDLEVEAWFQRKRLDDMEPKKIVKSAESFDSVAGWWVTKMRQKNCFFHYDFTASYI